MSKITTRRATALLVPGAVLAAILTIGMVYANSGAVPRMSGRNATAPSHEHAQSTQPSTQKQVARDATAVPAAGTARLQVQTTAMTSDIPLVITGVGFQPGERVTLSVQDQRGHTEAQLGSATVDPTGRISDMSVAVPPGLAPGRHTVVAHGKTSQDTAQAGFTMQRIPPRMQLDTYSVKPMQTFGFAGSGFIPGEPVTIYLGGANGSRLTTVRADTMGDVQGRVKLALTPAGNSSIYIVGQQSKTPISVGFNVQAVTPWVVLESYALKPSAPIRFNAQDFAPGETVLVYLNQQKGTPVTQIATDSFGRLANGKIAMPSGLSGSNELILVGQETGAKASATFTVLPDQQPKR